MTDALDRFRQAQAPILATVEAELSAGAKRSHWMWFVFPQLRGLGRSPTAEHYGIADAEEARAYLADAVLGDRLRRHVGLLLAHEGRSARAILGSPDDLKLRSCLTLFREVAAGEDRALFQQGLDAFYGGEPDEATLRLLSAG